ncbi:CRP/FNR family transcriptional regulator [Alkalibaculum bacchi]|uniref:CRP/FNR family transcriptional regulator n=1 Tax=Alkalibaculum bacchi TaxID=645887 RepID=A0A366I7G1_9FIRM|nr:Crp/Fnr family transcriptional regulator [Alkalibaculum bacchi]RBP63353.1 CRP/FNR family transcriptional regulator [Alkalibaculum bacchi]
MQKKESVSCHSEKKESSNCNHHCNGGEMHESCVSLVPIFNHLDGEQMNVISKVIRSNSYKKGEIIYKPGDKSDSLYIVSKGKIKIYRLSEMGKEQLVRILTAGDFTGELAVFSESIHESYAEAMKDTEVCMITRTDLQELLGKFSSISLKLLSEFSRRLEDSEKQTTRISTEKVDTRIAQFLIECVEDQQEGTEFPLPMSKKDLASYLGTTPETISRKLTEFEELGYIKQTRRKIKILDAESLLLV